MRLVAAQGVDAGRVALVAAGERRDLLGDGRREQQGAALHRRGIQDLLQVLAEPEVEHLVGFVEHDDLQGGEVERAAFDVVAQAAGRSDHHVGAGLQGAALGARVHAADAGRDPGAGVGEEPLQFPADLQGELAGGGDHEGQRRLGAAEVRRLAQEAPREREAESHGLAGAGLGRNQQVAAVRLGQHGGLHRRRFEIAVLLEGAGERGVGRGKRHSRSLGRRRNAADAPKAVARPTMQAPCSGERL